MISQLIYLHDFASSPDFSMARYFRNQFAERGLALQAPDLNVPDFEHLTLTAILERIAETVRRSPVGPVYLIGASFGALAALHFMGRYADAEGARVAKLLLIGPVFEPTRQWQKALNPAQMARWRETGWMDVLHFASNTPRPLHYGYYEDLQNYDTWGLRVDVPILIYHGLRDQTIDVIDTARFAQTRPNVVLELLDGDHELLSQQGPMWNGMNKFFRV
jgi:uncharacterized protein